MLMGQLLEIYLTRSHLEQGIETYFCFNNTAYNLFNPIPFGTGYWDLTPIFTEYIFHNKFNPIPFGTGYWDLFQPPPISFFFLNLTRSHLEQGIETKKVYLLDYLLMNLTRSHLEQGIETYPINTVFRRVYVFNPIPFGTGYWDNFFPKNIFNSFCII